MKENRIKNSFDVHDYHEWYSTIDEEPIDESNVGFLWNGYEYKQFNPIGMYWNDSFCRNIKPEENFGCYVEVENHTHVDKLECNFSTCYFYRWEGQFQKIRWVMVSSLFF